MEGVMSKNIEEIVDEAMPKGTQDSNSVGFLAGVEFGRTCLKQALTEKKLVVPMSK